MAVQTRKRNEAHGPATGPQRLGIGWRILLGLEIAVILLALGAVDAFSVDLFRDTADGWQQGSRSGWIVSVVVPGAVAVAPLLGRRVRSSRVGLTYGALCVVMTVASVAIMLRMPFGITVPDAIDHTPGPEATRQAFLDLATRGDCVVIDHDGVLRAPFERCTDDGYVSYIHDARNPDGSYANRLHLDYGFVYAPNVTDPADLLWDSCVRRLDHGWWAYMGEGNPGRPCATSFQFVGAG